MIGSILLALGAFAAGAGASYLLQRMPEREEKAPAPADEAALLATEDVACEEPCEAAPSEVLEEAPVSEAAAAEETLAEQAAPTAECGAPTGDEKLAEALAVGLEEGKMSTSLLQRRLGIGYGRALKLVTAMEELGLVSAADGYRARKLNEEAVERYLETIQNK